MGFPGDSMVKNLPVMREMQETPVRFLGQKDPLEEETQSSIFASEIPRIEESGGLQSMGLQKSRT